ncbi:MAG: Cys-tRNA(Pro) deacylase [Desulfobacterales bacterium]|jgi:Cys-tRNA(Pro)/Cys-tRNA(Cys) deacylase
MSSGRTFPCGRAIVPPKVSISKFLGRLKGSFYNFHPHTIEGVVSTRAISFLKKKKIPYEVVKYEHKEKGAEFAARATGHPLERTVKTLVLELDRKNYCLALVPGHIELNLKELAAHLGVKRTAMVDIKTAERLTGYLVGGISPFGTKQRLWTIMESSILNNEEVLINAGQRGMMLKMAPDDILRALDCRVAPVARK